MEKLICNVLQGKAKNSRFAWIGALAFAAGGFLPAFAGQEAIHLEHPRVWYAFDNTNNVQASSGAANLTFTNAGATFEKASDDDWAITSVSGQCPYGTGFPCGDGSWTIVMRAKTVADANRIVLGTQSITAGNRGLVMYTAGGDKVRFSVIENFVNFEATLEITVTDAATAYHDYAISLDAADRRVHVSVDGVDCGSIPHPHYNKSQTSFQFFSMNGGPGDSGLVVGEGCAIADYRVYQRILTAAELSALHAGRTPVPVHGGFLPGYDVTVWRNTQLKDIVRIRARTGGSSIGKEWAVPFYATHTPEVYDVQMQYIQDPRYNKVMWAHFTQNGDDVKAKMNKVGYLEPNSYGNYGVKGTVANDFSINWVNNNTTAIGNQTAGYGLYQLTADTLYDEGAAVWTAGAGDFSTAANWKDGRAAEAGRNVSFVTGSGTVQNDLAAGTAFGRLAFGVESGSWTLAGNAATFAEVVNASTNAQTIAFPMAYAGDFKPETLGTLTFTNLTVGGTFQPVGVGDVEFSGETAIETADVRYNVRTWDNPARYPLTSTGWTASKGYGTSQKKQIHLLRTLPGGHTEIGSLQTALTAQRIHATILDGDFTVRDAVALGSDALFVVTNGTTTLLSPLAPTSSLGVNAYAIVHAGAALKTPAFNAGTGMFLLVDGVADCDTASATGVMRIRWNGTLNTDLISGSGSVELDGTTIGPLEGPLAITMPVTCVAGSSLVTGVVFRTSAKDGSASVVSQTAALTQNAAVPVSVIGGGRYEYAVGGAFTGIAPFTVGAGTTADFTACSSAHFTNTVSLADGATLALPEWDGSAIFDIAPELPSSGMVVVTLRPDAALEAGDYTLVSGGVGADALDILDVHFVGPNASRFGLELSVEDGALKASVTRRAGGAMSARITFTGYTGSDALTDFPALIKLPGGVPGFAYADAAADGADIYFTDAAGNRIVHEVDTWNASGDSFVWVRVPTLADATSYVTFHWGGGAANVPALADPSSVAFAGDYMGVWHFADYNGSTIADSTTNALTMTAAGTTSGFSLVDSPVGKAVKNTSNAARFSTPNSSKWLQYVTTKQLTISGWFKAGAKAANQRIVSSKTNWQSAGGFEVTTRGTSGNEFLVGGANSAQYTKSGITSYYDNWVHFTATFDGTPSTPISRMYINGVEVANKTGADYSLQTIGNPLTFFSYGTATGGNTYIGNLDEVRLSKNARSADWIMAAYTTMKTPTAFATAGAVETSEVTPYDFRALATANTVTEETGAYTVYAGVDTTLTYPGDGYLVVEEGKKATVPSWNGSVENLGYVKYTGNTVVTEAPISGTTEYAGSHMLTFAESGRPLVFSGNVKIKGEYAILQYVDAPVTVTGGTTTLSGLMRIAERNADVGFGTNYGAVMNVTGGLVQSDGTATLDYSGYSARDMQINISGGRFTVPLRVWYSTTTEDMPLCTVNVSGTGDFAPEYFAQRNSGTITFNAIYFNVSGNGRFTAPASVPEWTVLTSGAGTPAVTAAPGAEVNYLGDVVVASGTTLAFAGDAAVKPYFAMNCDISGAGTIAVENAILDLTGDVSFADFTGSLTVRDGGVIILPADEVAPFPITLEAGARVIATVTETPDNTAAFLGAIASLPASGTATIELDLPNSMPEGAVYTLSTSELPAGAAEHLAVEFGGAAGATTAGAVGLGENGEVTVTITESENKGGTLVWAGATSETVTANESVLAWERLGGDGTKLPFYPNLPLLFNDTAALKTVQVADAVKTGPVTFDAAGDYTLRGAAKIDATTVEKKGAGTLEVNGAGFAAPETVTVKGGVLKLGDGATMDSVGNKDTRIVVKDGATIDLNTKLSTSNDKGRGAVLQNSIVEISGTGVDGRGAITDESGEYADIWHNQLGRVVVASNATIAGTSRIDLRKPDNATYEGNTSLTGGDDVTLTIATHVPEDANCGLNFNNSDVAIGKIELADGGMVGFEGATALNVPHGIEMKSNSRIHYWASSGTKAAITVTGTGAGLKASSSDVNIQDKPVTVQEGASLDLRGDKALTYSAAFTNEGAVTVSGGTHKITGTELAGEGTFAVSAGDLQFNPVAASGALNLSVSGGSAHVGAAADWSAVPMTLAMTGGTFWWGMGEAAGFPIVTSLDASGITSGLIDFHSGAASATVPAQFASANPNDIKFYNSADNQTITIPAGNWTVKSRIGVANGSYPGHLVFGNGANVSANNLTLAIDSSAPKTAIVEIGPGSTLTLSDYARIGEYSGASEYWHEVIVNGGTFSCANVFAVAYDSPLCYATLSSGRMSVGGLNVRSRTTYIYDNSDERFTMTGGELDLGASGLTTARMKYNNTHANLQGGLYKATANHNVGYYGMLVATGEDMDDPGELTIDLNGKTVTHGNTPHFGSSAVTLTGEGSYVTSSDWQGIVKGKWTVDTAASATVNLTGFAGFAGGLELKDGTSASLGISGESAVEYVALRGYGSSDAGYTYVTNNGAMPSVASHLKMLCRSFTSNQAPLNSSAFAARGQFYVDEDDAGTWTFAGNFDDQVALWVDGVRVFYNASYNSVATAQAEMTAGWHDFVLVTYDGTGSQGPYVSDWKSNAMCLGWKKGTSTSKAAADYNRFDTSTLRMRVKKPITSDGVTVERVAGNYSNIDTLRARTDWAPLWETNTLQNVLNTKIAQQQTSSMRCTGGFLVDEAHEGEWTFYGSWDDRIILTIDGVEVLANTAYNKLATSTAKLTAGWHAFEIRFGDGTGGYGPDAANLNGGYGLAVMRPGDTAKQPFDERTFTLTTKALVAQLTERPGLGGVTTVGAGATLSNGSPWSGANLNGRFCPIYGTLKGSGTLAGPYRFTGDDNSWEVTDAGANNGTLPCVNFSDATPATFAGLKSLSVTFDAKPSRSTYYLTGAITGLTDADIPAATLTVKDANDGDYSANFTLTVQNGRLALSNSRPAGTYIFVR